MVEAESPRTIAAQVFDSIRRIGYCRTGSVILSRLADYVFDLRYGTDTVQTREVRELDVQGEQKHHAQRYQPTGSLPFRRLMRLYRFPKSSVLVDFGSGKGRVLLMGMLYGFRKVIGIEFSGPLCHTARENLARLAARLASNGTTAEVVQQDAAEYILAGDEDLFYFFHPFDDEILRRILVNINTSLERRPRRAWIVYYLPVHVTALEAHAPRFALLGQHLLSGYPCRVYGTAYDGAEQ